MSDYILTRQQRAVIKAMLDYETADFNTLAERFVVSPDTIRTHVQNAAKRLNVRGRAEVLIAALKRGEVTM